MSVTTTPLGSPDRLERGDPHELAEQGPSRAILSLALVLGVVLVFGQTIAFSFLALDDPYYVTENPVVQAGLTLHGFRWAWVTDQAGLWHPLTWISLMIDVDLWGNAAAGHHLGNVVLHAGSAVLLFLSLDRLSGRRWRSWLVASLFALHPLRADSVAWITERKDTLCTFFTLLTLLFYAAYAAAPSLRRFVPVLLAFACALLSKAMAVPFPAALLLVDLWPLRRNDRTPLRRLLLEKAPLLVLSAVCVAATYHAHRAHLAPTPASFTVPNVVVSYARQLSHIVYPTHLSIYYPRSLEGGAPPSVAAIAGSSALLVGLLVLAVTSRRRAPCLAFGLAWFAGLLFPVSGVLQSGFAAMCDRFTYVPCIGVLVAGVWWACEGLDRRGVGAAPRRAVAALLVSAYATCAFVEVSHYRDDVTAFSHAIDSTGENWMAESILGGAALVGGDPSAAVAHYQHCLRLKPDYLVAQEQLGNALEAAGRSADAIAQFDEILRADPDNARAQNAVCVSLVSLGRWSDAEACLRRAIAKDPRAPVPYANLAMLYEHTGRPDLGARVRREAATQLGHAL